MRCLRYPRKRTSIRATYMSALCQKRTPADSFDHLVGGREQRLRNGQSERFGGLNIDRQFKLRRELHRQVRRFRPFEDAAHITGRAALQVE